MYNYKYNLELVDSKNIFGTLNVGSVRLSNLTNSDRKLLMNLHNLNNPSEVDNLELSKDDKQAVFRSHRQALGEAYGFDWRKMYMADQTTKNGSYFELSRDYVEASPNGWSDIPEDILIITDKVPGVVAGHPVADCPVIMMEDRRQGITAVCHCSAELIDLKMPMLMADALTNGYKTRDQDIRVFIGACAGTGWTYNTWPKWATDVDMWTKTGALEADENGIYHIDLKAIIAHQLLKRNVGAIMFTPGDTITDLEYYSNSAASPYGGNDPSRFGRQFIGAFYPEYSKEKVKTK